MSILIKGMEMPTSCGECKAFVCYRQYAGDSGDCFCGITKKDAKAKEKNADCPLIPVSKHGRLIDADALNIYDISPVYGFSVMGVTEEDIIQASTIIPAEDGE